MALALITGASSGIGLAFARSWIQALPAFEQRAIRRYGANPEEVQLTTLLLQGRNETALEALRAELQTMLQAQSRNVNIEVCACDFCDPVAFQTFCERLETREEPWLLLFNGAGRGIFGPLMDLPASTSTLQHQLNIEALVRLSHLALPKLMRGGLLLNVASTAAHAPLPHMAVYAASKAYVLSLTRALAVEVERNGIQVMALCPGTVKTAFFDRAFEYGKVARLSSDALATTPERVADATVRAILKGRRELVTPFAFRVTQLLAKLLPVRVTLAVWKRFAKWSHST